MRPRTIELIAPCGYPQDPQAVARALVRWVDAGHHIQGIDTTERRFQRFAGTDAQRAADLNRLADPARALPDIVLAVRGGYGAIRLLHGLDYAGLQRRLAGEPIAICGHSDFTAIQMALLAHSGLITFGGPMLSGNFGAPILSEFTIEHFWAAISNAEFTIGEPTPQPDDVDLRGTLWGGNLAMIAALAGTPYLPNIDAGILFVEDVNEHPFRVERMLYQLHLAGILPRQQALVLGDFTGAQLSEYDNGYDFDAMVEQIRALIGIPVITGLRFGHGADTVTLPVGVPAQLKAGANGFTLTISGHPTLAE
jgi:muramoyltetrapeptide carboxypeptidase